MDKVQAHALSALTSQRFLFRNIGHRHRVQSNPVCTAHDRTNAINHLCRTRCLLPFFAFITRLWPCYSLPHLLTITFRLTWRFKPHGRHFPIQVHVLGRLDTLRTTSRRQKKRWIQKWFKHPVSLSQSPCASVQICLCFRCFPWGS